MTCRYDFTTGELEENHERFAQRQGIYRSRGIDFSSSRRFILEKGMPFRAPILEIGTGTGHMTLTLARAGYSFTAIDNDAEMLKITAMNCAFEGLHHRVTLQRMDACRMIFSEHEFATVVTVNMLHHAYNPAPFFSDVDRVLKPGGIVVIADFSEQGMKVVNEVHRAEGREHTVSGCGPREIMQFFSKRHYRFYTYHETYQWVMRLEKEPVSTGSIQAR